MTCRYSINNVARAPNARTGVDDATVSLSVGELSVSYVDRLTAPGQLKLLKLAAGYADSVTNAVPSLRSMRGYRLTGVRPSRFRLARR
jgi:hypothetical protein